MEILSLRLPELDKKNLYTKLTKTLCLYKSYKNPEFINVIGRPGSGKHSNYKEMVKRFASLPLSNYVIIDFDNVDIDNNNNNKLLDGYGNKTNFVSGDLWEERVVPLREVYDKFLNETIRQKKNIILLDHRFDIVSLRTVGYNLTCFYFTLNDIDKLYHRIHQRFLKTTKLGVETNTNMFINNSNNYKNVLYYFFLFDYVLLINEELKVAFIDTKLTRMLKNVQKVTKISDEITFK